MEHRPTQSRKSSAAKYLASPKGKAMVARKRKKEQEKKKALTKVKLTHARDRRWMTAAKFSDSYTVYSATALKQIESREFDHATKPIPANNQGINGLSNGVLKRQYNEQPSEPECVQGGIPRWSESTLNPAYRKHLAKQSQPVTGDFLVVVPTKETREEAHKAFLEKLAEEKLAKLEKDAEKKLADKVSQREMETRKFKEARAQVIQRLTRVSASHL
jgi:hypothetical protein